MTFFDAILPEWYGSFSKSSMAFYPVDVETQVMVSFSLSGGQSVGGNRFALDGKEYRSVVEAALAGTAMKLCFPIFRVDHGKTQGRQMRIMCLQPSTITDSRCALPYQITFAPIWMCSLESAGFLTRCSNHFPVPFSAGMSAGISNPAR